MIKSIKLQDFLSFGNTEKEIELYPLNVIIGTNGSGKSNFLEAFDLLKNAPFDISKTIREGGGISEWLYKGNSDEKHATISVVVEEDLLSARSLFRYSLAFNDTSSKFEIYDEKIEVIDSDNGTIIPKILYDYSGGRPFININSHDQIKMEKLELNDINTTQSIFAQKRDSIYYPEITHLAYLFAKTMIYRDWTFGSYTPPRLPQKVDIKNDYLEADCSNLCLVLNHMRNDLHTKKLLLNELQSFYADVEDYEVTFAGGQAQVFFQERGLRTSIPATRLSDGTLRYLCLLSILCHPNPPPLICIEEPELGLHPDIIPNIARLLIEASKHCQLIVTTHSEILIDSFSDTPYVVLIAEKTDMGTQLIRLDNNELKPWLEKYRLGALWSRGDIGGTRW